VADHRADQFAIGAVMYELIAYAEAFSGNSVPAITHKVLTEPPAPLDRLVPDVAPEIVAIVSRALEKNAADRFAERERWIEGLKQLAGEADVVAGIGGAVLDQDSFVRHAAGHGDSREQVGFRLFPQAAGNTAAPA